MDGQRNIDLSGFIPLTQTERQRARERAEKVMLRKIGPAPTPRQVLTGSSYPPALVLFVVIGVTLLLVAFFSISAFRLYHMGAQLFGGQTDSKTLLGILQICLIAGAEIGQVIFTLAAAVIAEDYKWDRRWLYMGAAISTLIAVVGNVQQAYWPIRADVFAAIEAFSPPIVFLFGANVLKHIALENVRKHQEVRAQFVLDYQAWERSVDRYADHPEWLDTFANALRDALIFKNKRIAAKLRELGPDDWVMLVQAEMRKERWFSAPRPEISQKLQQRETVSQEQVLDALRGDPSLASRQGKEIAEITGASPATVSRALQKFSTNGHNHKEDTR